MAAVIAAAAVFSVGTAVPEKPIIAITASAEETADGFVIKTDSDGDRYVAGYNGAGGNITIPSDVTWIGSKAFTENTSITSVTIPENCWYWVDSNAFSYCTALKSVTFEGSIDGIGANAFYGCTALETVTFGGNVGRDEGDGGIGYCAFAGCTYLRTVKFTDPGARLDLVGDYAFMNCTRLTSINLPVNTGTLYTGAFFNCANLSEITVPSSAKFDGDWVMGYMYGRETADGEAVRVKADGTAALYPAKLAGLPKAEKRIIQKSLTMAVVSGSAAETYAANNGIACVYTSDTQVYRLSSPKNVSGKAGAGGIVLTWDAVDGAAGYRVYQYDPASGKYRACKSVRGAKCTVDGLESGTEYSFRVATLDVSGSKYVPGYASETVSVTAE
ncbi:MAG: fibronectin type III domain-containing protein [Ruminococcus sp.]|nr:fibronectin type III domain-containing protein [Ruminococcus sp.]